MLFHITYSDEFQELGMPAPEIVHLFDPLDFLAELTPHIPPARVQLIRRYGLYSSRIPKGTLRAILKEAGIR